MTPEDVERWWDEARNGRGTHGPAERAAFARKVAAAARAEATQSRPSKAVRREKTTRILRERDDARNLVAEVASGVTHYQGAGGCGDPGPCVRCQRDEARERVKALEEFLAKWEACVSKIPYVEAKRLGIIDAMAGALLGPALSAPKEKE